MTTNRELALTWLQGFVGGEAGGGTDANIYVIAVRVRDSKVVEMKEFSDSLRVFEAIDAPETRGPRKPLKSPLTTLTASVQGPTAGAELS